MAARTAVPNGLKVTGLEDLPKLDTPLTNNGIMVEPVNGWCGGDCPEDVAEPQEDNYLLMSFKDELNYKNTLIDELQKSNHDLRLKLAEAETKIAQMRVKIDAHCECCARGMGVEEAAEKKRYTSNDWSSGCSFGVDFTQMSPTLWAKEVPKIPEDNVNPYVKVSRWQNTFIGENLRETESNSSSYILKRSPNCMSLKSGANTRPESPATSGLTGDYILLPLVDSSPSKLRTFVSEEVKAESPLQKFSLFRRDQINYSEEEQPSSPHLTTVKSSPDERILSSRQHRISDSSIPSGRIQSLHSPRDYDKMETHIMDQYKRSVRQSMQNSWVQHENRCNLSTWGRPNDNGIVGMLMRDSDRN